MVVAEEFRNPPVRARIKPFWFWNGQMTKEEIRRQIQEMAKKGLGGMFICARQGMTVPYLSDEWFELVDFACREAKVAGLEAWLYDEYPYPSGMSGGEVLLEHPEAEHKVLKHECFDAQGGEMIEKMLDWSKVLCAKAFPVREDKTVDWENGLDLSTKIGVLQTEKIYQQTGLTRYNNKRFFSYEPQKVLKTTLPEGTWSVQIALESSLGDFKYYGGFFDPCNKEAVRTFLNTTHERYARTNGEEFGVSVFGMFSDEVGLLSPIPWSPEIAKEFTKRNGYSITEHLPALFDRTYPNAAKIRYDLYETAHQVFRESYHKQVSDWCREHKLWYATEVPSMRHSTQRFSDIVGGDTAHEKLGRSLEWIYDAYLPNYRSNAKAVSSLARQLGKPYAMIESFHSVGWTMTMEDAKWMIDRLGSSGINLYNFHAFYYTIQDITKHDAPPSQFLQNPYWTHYRKLADYVGRMGVLVGGTEAQIEIAVLDPIAALWTKLGNPFHGFPYRGEDADEKSSCDQIRDRWVAVCKELLFAQLDYDHLDDEMLAEARIIDGKLCIGRAGYSVVVLPECDCMERASRDKLEAFVKAGGHVIAIGQLPSVSIEEEESDEETKKAWEELAQTDGAIRLAGDLAKLPDACRRWICEKARVKVLSGDHKSVIGVVRKETESGALFVFAANQGSEPVQIQIATEKMYDISQYDLESGSVCEHSDTFWLEGFESRWLCLRAVSSEKNTVLKEKHCVTIPMQGEWNCRLLGENLCRFGGANLSLDGVNWTWEEAKTFIEQCNDQKLLGGELLQMEGDFGTPRKIRPAYPITCRYRVHFQIQEKSQIHKIALLLDRETISGAHEIWVNGQTVDSSSWQNVWINDQNNRASDIFPYLNEGENTIEIAVTIEKDEDGLRDPFYLMGDFAVEIKKSEEFVLTPMARTACPDAPWVKGLPFYSGVMEFEREVTVDKEADSLRLGWSEPHHDCTQVLIDGENVGVKAYAPWVWECETPVCPGTHVVTVRIYNTLANMLDGTYFDYKHHRLVKIGEVQ